MEPPRNQFIADAKDIVDRLYADLQQLRVVRSQGRQRRELASRIFRHVHTLKGSAGSLGLPSVSEVAHEFEGVLDGVRLGRVAIDDALLNLFEDATDAIAETLANSRKGGESNTQSLVARLHGIAWEASQHEIMGGNLRESLPDEIGRSLSEYDLQHAREAVREGARLFIVDTAFEIETFDRDFRELTRLLGKTGEIIATVPGAPPTADEISLRLLYAAEIVTDELHRQAAEFAAFECAQVQLDYTEAAADIASPVPGLAPELVTSITSVRIGLNDLNELTSAVTDLLRDTTNALSGLRKSSDAALIDAAQSNLRREFVQLEERLIKLRLVPLSELLNGAAARAGRVAARDVNKTIEFEIIGGDVGIDKSLADSIAEPLMHLVRNAVSHGIETSEERIGAGKPACGSVTLHGFSEGSRIHIVVSDDGRGIDLDRVAQCAVQQGIVNRTEDLTADQALRLIFRPGFSTSPAASGLSGRGVGLEIVDRAMAESGGEVRLASQPGKGATFVMIIPSKLALVPCVVVRSGKQFYCFDSSIIAARLTLAETPIAEGDQDFEWQGEQLPLLRLNDLLAHSDVAGNGRHALLVCKPTQHRHALASHQKPVAILVEAIAGQQETLVRSFGPHSNLWHGISGAAEMLDGSVALMIDLPRLIEAYED